MEPQTNHIRNLVYFAYVDGHLHEEEKAFILSVGDRLGMESAAVESLLADRPVAPPPLPVDEVRKFILLDDIFNVITADGVIEASEKSACEEIAANFGFDKEVVEGFLDKLSTHLEAGFVKNQIAQFIKQETYFRNAQNSSDAKYS
jgi:uncharacterized tellurite resistance protein B-like protein